MLKQHEKKAVSKTRQPFYKIYNMVKQYFLRAIPLFKNQFRIPNILSCTAKDSQIKNRFRIF